MSDTSPPPSSATPASPARPSIAATILRYSGIAWFLTAATGQVGFILFIVFYYYTRTFTGNLAGWNDKGLIKGYVPGDTAGNAMFAIHVLLAAVITLSGILQLIPGLRRRAPRLHWWSGRIFMLLAVILAAGGLWMVVGRSTYLSVISAIAGGLNGVLILLVVPVTLYFAIRRQIDTHRRWAMRLWLLVSGVWFIRIGYMAFVILTGGGFGMNETMSGPADIAIQLGSYMIPLTVLQLYFMAQDSTRAWPKLVTAGLVFICTLVTAAGVFGAIAFMWLPYM